MRYFLSFSFFLFSLICPAQERYLDDIFESQEAVTETYAVKDGEELKLDIYQPKKDTARSRPLIVFMHGGGFAGGTRTNEAEVKFAQAAARKGYVAVQISYRLTRKGQSFGCDYEASGKIETFQKAAEDFMDAVQFMLKNAENLGSIPKKLSWVAAVQVPRPYSMLFTTPRLCLRILKNMQLLILTACSPSPVQYWMPVTLQKKMPYRESFFTAPKII